MSLDTKFLLGEIDKLFAKQDAKWDQWFAARDAKWNHRFSSRKGTLPIQITEQPALAPTTATVITDEIHNSTELPAPAPATTTSPLPTSPDVAAAEASLVAPTEGADMGQEVPLEPRVTSTAAGAAEIINSVEPLSASQLQPGAANLLQSTPLSISQRHVVTLPTELVGRHLLGHSPPSTASSAATSDAKYIPASAASAASTDAAAATPSATALTTDFVHCGSVDAKLATAPAEKLFLLASTGIHITIAPSNTTACVHNICSIYCRSGFPSMLNTELHSSTPTWVFGNIINGFDKRPWPPPPQAPVFSEQGMHKLVVGTLIDAKPDVIWSKFPWPPPIRWFMQAAGTPLRPIPWPSFGYFADHWVVLWIPWKIPWLFSTSLCWISDALPGCI